MRYISFGKARAPPARGPRKRRAVGESLVLILVAAGKPGSQTIHDSFVLRVQVYELGQFLGQPAERDIVVAAPLGKLLDPAVGEVHSAPVS